MKLRISLRESFKHAVITCRIAKYQSHYERVSREVNSKTASMIYKGRLKIMYKI